MKRLALAFIALTALNANAEMRFLNFTGQPLQINGVDITASTDLTAPIGQKLSPGSTEILVVKSKDGSDLFRDERQAGDVYILNFASQNRFAVSKAGQFQGARRGHGAQVINATGRDLQLNLTMADSTQKTRKVTKAGANGLRTVKVGIQKGDQMTVEIDGTKSVMKDGSVYLITDNGGIQVKEVAYD